MLNLSVFGLKIFLDTKATCWCIAHTSKRHSTRQPISKRHSTRHLKKCPCRSSPLSSSNILLYYNKPYLIKSFSSVSLYSLCGLLYDYYTHCIYKHISHIMVFPGLLSYQTWWRHPPRRPSFLPNDSPHQEISWSN